MFKFEENAIREFQGKHRFLSNFWRQPFKVLVKVGNETKKLPFLTNEHYYQAMKAETYDGFMYVRDASTAYHTKRRGRGVSLRSDWDNVKLNVMMHGLQAKFKLPDLRCKLIETYPCQLVEGNVWNDTFWGVCLKTGEGVNALGQLLMKVREEAVRESMQSRLSRSD